MGQVSCGGGAGKREVEENRANIWSGRRESNPTLSLEVRRRIAIIVTVVLLLAGGLFLVWKATTEIHGSIEGEEEKAVAGAKRGFAATVAQIALIDIVFSVDSIITISKSLRDSVNAVVGSVAITVALRRAPVRSEISPR